MPRSSRTSPMLPLAVAVLAALVAGVAFAAPRLDGAAGEEDRPVRDVHRSETTPQDDPLAALARREPGDPMALGDVDAPVVMIAYSEFQCPFCGTFARDTAPELVERYVREGTLRIEWRDFPYLGPESRVAALGGRAAAEQDRFWEFHDAMYADQLPPNSGSLDEDYLVGVARRAGLDVDRFRDQLRRGDDLARAVERDFARASRSG